MLTKEQLWASRIDDSSAQSNTVAGSIKDRNVLFPKPVIGIDRDGILLELTELPIKDRSQCIPIPGALEAVALIRQKGYKIVIIFDQPEISTGEITTTEVDNMNTYLFELLGMAGCTSVDGLYYCTSSNKQDMFSKHNTGMFNRAENELKLSFRDGGYYVGDSIEDLEVATKIKATPVLINTGNYENTIDRLNTFSKRNLRPKIKQFNTLLDFAVSLK
jgi:D-glycero-D-manno-heptose 1,7-bisphosphate phosphatase